MSPEISELLERVENWRRFYRITQTINAVSWYTEPDAGDVWDTERIMRISPDMRDAIKLELTWQLLTSQPKKWYIKHEFISRLPRPVVWRKLKKLGIRLNGNAEFEAFSDSALYYFNKSLNEHRA